MTFSAPAFTADSPATAATVGVPYSSYSFAASGKSDAGLLGRVLVLPAGLTLDPVAGTLSGTPTAVGTSTFTVQAANGVGSPAVSGSITINVSQYLPLQLSVPGGALGTPDSGDGASAGTLDPVTSGPPGTLADPEARADSNLERRCSRSGRSGRAARFRRQASTNTSCRVRSAAPVRRSPTCGFPTPREGHDSVALEGAHQRVHRHRFVHGHAQAPPRLRDRSARFRVPPRRLGLRTERRDHRDLPGTDDRVPFHRSKGPSAAAPTLSRMSTQPGVYTMRASGATRAFSTNTSFTVGNIPVGAAPGPDDWASWGFNQQQDRVNPTETTIGASNVSKLSPKWTAQLSRPDLVEASPYEANGIVYVGTVHGMIYAFNQQSGNLLWSFQALGPVYGTPTIVNGIAYFGTVDVPNEGVVGNWAIRTERPDGRRRLGRPTPQRR